MKRLLLVSLMVLCLLPAISGLNVMADRFMIGEPVEPVGIVPEQFAFVTEQTFLMKQRSMATACL